MVAKSLELNPDNASTHYYLGNLLLHKTARLDESLGHLERSAEIENRPGSKPKNFSAYYDLGLAYDRRGWFADAAQSYRRALAIQPQFTAARNKLAWLYATCALSTVRDGVEAVRLAMHSERETHGQSPEVLRILARAHAAEGNFKEALDVAQRAHSMAQMRGEIGLAAKLTGEIAMYRANTPLHETPPQ